MAVCALIGFKNENGKHQMKFQLFSDLHMEFFRKAPALGQVSVHPDADAVVLAGDIDSGENAFRQAYEIAQRSGKQVILVPGNHEYYHEDYEILSRKFAAASRDGVHVLIDDQVVIDGVRFVGGTLWTDFGLYEGSRRMPTKAEALAVGAASLNDFRIIKANGSPFTTEKSAEAHARTRAFIEGVCATPHDGPTVVVSHHAPHQKSIGAKYAPGERVLNSTHRLPDENRYWRINVCFASNLEPMLEHADVWVHGHVHDSFEYQVGKCRVYANPRGYPSQGNNGELKFENPLYDPMKLIEV